MYSLAKQPEGILAIINTTFTVLIRTFIKILPFTILMILIEYIALFLLEPKSKDPTNALVYFLLRLVFYVFQLAFIYGVISSVIEGKNLNTWTLAKIGLKRLLPTIGLGFAYILILLPAIFVFVIGAALGDKWIYVSLIFVIPYFIFIILKLAFSMLLISIPGKGVWQSIEESSELVSGRLLKLICYLLLPLIIAALLVGGFILLSPIINNNISEYLLIGFVFTLPILSVFSIELSYIYFIVIMHNFQLEKNAKDKTQEKSLDVKA